MNMFLRNSKIFKSKLDKSSIYGTINKNNPKAFFFEFKTQVIPTNITSDINKYVNKIQKNINIEISKEIENYYSNLFLKEYIITIIDLKSSIINHKTKKINADVEITIKPIGNILKNKDIESILNEINVKFKRIINDSLINFNKI